MSEEHRKFSENEDWRGVFVGKCAKVMIPTGGLTVGMNQDGTVVLSCTLHIGLNLCRRWLKIACSHLFEAEKAYVALLQAHTTNDDQGVADSLESEFEAGMQAMTAAAIAIDSYYASVKDYLEIAEELTESWRANKTARCKQVNEVFRRAFPIFKKRSNLKDVLREIYKFRDLAVHPSADASAPVHYPEILRSVEWRHSAFRFHNAKKSVMLSLQIIDLTTNAPYPKSEKMKNYLISLRANFEETFDLWKRRYGGYSDNQEPASTT